MRTVLSIVLAASFLFVSATTIALADDRKKDDATKLGAKKAPLPLRQAHAHNDYNHRRPLLDALDHGFTSVEADIFLVDGKLLVAHGRRELKPERTLRSLYLDPLRERVRKNDGRVQRGGPEFTLMIDIKDDGVKTFTALHKVLTEYAKMLTEVRNGKLKKRAVRVIISGNRPLELVRSLKIRYAGVDGRLSDLDSKEPAHLLPMISDNWGRVFKWRGEGPMPAPERAKLREVVKKAHARGRIVRFWATRELTSIWKELHAAGVDRINTDDLAGLQKFLLQLESKTKTTKKRQRES
jgi:hypothetical protein